MATKKTTKSSSKKPVQKKLKSVPKPKSQIKAKKAAPVAPPQPQKPVQKIHPFAQFMKGRISSHYSSAPMQKLSNHDTYRKKAV